MRRRERPSAKNDLMTTPPESDNAKVKQELNTKLWLVLSLVGNFFLVIFLYIATDPLGQVQVAAPVENIGPLIKTNVVVRHENFIWDQVESTNYAVFVKNLRAIGCPEQTIRDIIMSDLDRLYSHRRLSEVVFPNFEWWRADPDPDAVKAARDKVQELEAERRTVLNALLGTNWYVQNNEEIAANGGITLTGPILGDLPPDTRDAVLAIAARAQLKIEAYQEQLRDQNLPVDPVEMVRLREEPLLKLIAVLNPSQYIEYSLRYSPGAQQLREQLRSIELTSDQFRDLYNADIGIVGQPAYYYAGTVSDLAFQAQQLHTQSDAVIKAVLGDQLWAAYQLNQDPLYRSARTLADQLGVPASTATALYEVNRTTKAELDRIRKDDSLSNDEKVEAISQAQVEQQQSLEQILGAEGFQKWLNLNSFVH